MSRPATLLDHRRTGDAPPPPASVRVDALREANHRITNNLSLIAGFVRLQAMSLARAGSALSAEEACLLLEDVASRIETVGRLHRLLAESGQGAAVDLGAYLSETCRALVSSLAADGDVELTEDFRRGCLVRQDQILPLALIVSEVVINSIKYAHPSGVPGTIAVGCRAVSPGVTLVEVQDDGVGLPEGFDPTTAGGLGSRIIRGLAQQLGAEWGFGSEGLGLRFSLAVPVLH